MLKKVPLGLTSRYSVGRIEWCRGKGVTTTVERAATMAWISRHTASMILY